MVLEAQASDARLLMDTYRDWADSLVPAVHFSEFIDQVDLAPCIRASNIETTTLHALALAISWC